MNIKPILSYLVCLGLFGCNHAQTPEEPPPPTTTAVDAPAAEPTISLEVKSWDEIQEVVAEQQGKVVVLDLWSTWCEPCIREFPNLVQLHRSHPDDIVCISFDLDYSGAADESPESYRDSVHEFLQKHGATFTNAISSDAADDVFNRLDLGSVPAVLVYGRDGRLVKRFDNDDGVYGDEGFTYEDHIVPLVDSLLAEDESQ
jgi:thiol-disulfide isomerase/thioredoxin